MSVASCPLSVAMGLTTDNGPLSTVKMDQPHFIAPHDPPQASLAQLLVRAADCLRALLHEPTAEAGLNETRFNVLDLLRRSSSGSCSQSEIAARLLQSESNLSTLLDRMHTDGLISRMRSKTDRRRVAIGLAPAGCEALSLADRQRGRASHEALQALDETQQALLRDGLQSLICGLECKLTEVTPTAVLTTDHGPRATDNCRLSTVDCQIEPGKRALS